jgi:peptidoglycan/xylan/chitin deacetylase (PgdA/CDA1 family)
MSPYNGRGCVVRVVYLALALVAYLLRGAGRVGRGGAVVLCYHLISEPYREAFARQMSCIARRAISLDQLRGAKSHRLGVLPGVCVTFDDGYEDFLANAAPILEQSDVPATLFIVPGNLGDRPQWNMRPGDAAANERLMDRAQIDWLLKHRRIQVGSHTLMHANLMTLDVPNLRKELQESRIALEDTFRTPVDAVAFPYGACDADVLDAAESAGYSLACTLEPRLYSPPDGLRVGRFAMEPDAWPIEFYLTCAGAYSWLFPLRRWVARGRAVLAGLHPPKRTGEIREAEEATIVAWSSLAERDER